MIRDTLWGINYGMALAGFMRSLFDQQVLFAGAWVLYAAWCICAHRARRPAGDGGPSELP